MKKIIVLLAVTLVIFSCKKMIPDNVTKAYLKDNLFTHSYETQLPYAQLNDNTPTDNQFSDAKTTLGRVLFYDTRLSINNNISCASCHEQSKAFADGKQFSTGFDGNKTTRNSMALTNLTNADKLFWDGRTSTLEQLALEPVSHPVEMGFEKIELLPKKIALIDYYQPLFQTAYGNDEITEDKIAKALAQFLRAMTTFNAPIDKSNIPNGSWGTNIPHFDQSEKSGLLLFNQSSCGSCHNGPNFGGSQFNNIGLETTYTDPGMGSAGSNQEGFFKVPSLRNVALTAPYMHDGRFATLKDVLKHYGKDIQPHANLAPILTNSSWGNPNDNSPVQFNFTDSQIDNLEAFLKTMTDETFVKDQRFSDPFIRE